MAFEVRVGCFGVDILQGRTGVAYDWWSTTCMVDYLGPPAGWEWYYCFDFLSQGPANPFPVSSLPQCLSACAAYPNAYFLWEDREDHYTCACYQRGPPFTDYDCGVGKAMHYYHTPSPTDSAAVRRKQRAAEEAQKEMSRDFEICPAGFRACRVPEENQISYECIDTSSELESCGGCLFGEINASSQVVNTPSEVQGEE
ncbi:hypothetical protein I317_01371 [Kwoniella heveanensis CBS 569]|nr:hypothetical protein I317_01371 [Kwoniella heveanensis CBS 569]